MNVVDLIQSQKTNAPTECYLPISKYLMMHATRKIADRYTELENHRLTLQKNFPILLNKGVQWVYNVKWLIFKQSKWISRVALLIILYMILLWLIAPHVQDAVHHPKELTVFESHVVYPVSAVHFEMLTPHKTWCIYIWFAPFDAYWKSIFYGKLWRRIMFISNVYINAGYWTVRMFSIDGVMTFMVIERCSLVKRLYWCYDVEGAWQNLMQMSLLWNGKLDHFAWYQNKVTK